MRGIPHLLIGASVGVLLAGGTGRQAWPIVAVAAGSALLPDLDHPTSTASGLFRGATGVAGLVVGAGATAAALERTHDVETAVAIGTATWVGVLFLTQRLAPWRLVAHRGPFHSVLVALVGGALAYMVTGRSELAVAVLAGWGSHLVADDPTYMGQPLFWPVSSRLVHVTPWPFRWRSGTGWIEWPLSVAALVLAVHPYAS